MAKYKSTQDEKPSEKSLWLSVYEKMSIHVSGASPEPIIRKHRKADPDPIIEGKLENYTPFTKASIQKAIDKASRILRDSAYSINTELLSDYVQDYINLTNIDLKEELDFNDFFLKYVWAISVEDPNAVLVTMPEFPEDVELIESLENLTSEQPENIRLVQPDFDQVLNSNVGIEVRLIRSKHIEYITKYEMSWYGGEWIYRREKDKDHAAPYYWVIDTEYIYLNVPLKKEKGQIIYGLVPYYFHNIGKIPSTILGGNLVTKDDICYYDSYFAPFAEWGHKAIKRYADLDTIIDINGYPVKILEPSPCHVCEGRKKIKDKEDNYQVCSTCSGKGVIYDISPSSVYEKKEKTYKDQDGERFLPVEWAEAPTGQMTFLDEHIDKLLQRAEESLNLLFNDGANSSGVAMDIRREDAHNMLFKISENLFRVIDDHLYFVHSYLFLDREPDYSIIKPFEFGIKTFADLIEEKTKLISAGANPAMIARVEKNIAKQRFPEDELIQRVIDLQSKYDILYGMNPMEINQLKAAGAVTDKDVKVHANIYKELSRMDLDREDEVVFSELDTKFLRFDVDQFIPL